MCKSLLTMLFQVMIGIFLKCMWLESKWFLFQALYKFSSIFLLQNTLLVILHLI